MGVVVLAVTGKGAGFDGCFSGLAREVVRFACPLLFAEFIVRQRTVISCRFIEALRLPVEGEYGVELK